MPLHRALTLIAMVLSVLYLLAFGFFEWANRTFVRSSLFEIGPFSFFWVLPLCLLLSWAIPGLLYQRKEVALPTQQPVDEQTATVMIKELAERGDNEVRILSYLATQNVSCPFGERWTLTMIRNVLGKQKSGN